MALYGDGGQRRIQPPLVFGAGVLWHLLRHGRPTTSCTPRRFRTSRCSPPRCCARSGRYRIVVDWFELWSREYWREYLGGDGRARSGRAVQNLCLRVRQHAFCFAELTARAAARGRAARRGDGAARDVLGPGDAAGAGAGRAARRVRRAPHPGEARARRRRAPSRRSDGVRGLVLGDGPEYERVKAEIERARRRRPRRGARLRRDRAGRARAGPRALPRAPLAPRGLRARGRRGGLARARRRCSSATPTTRRPS